MQNTRTLIQTPDELDILSAIWILSCNDEIPEMTYEGIKYRLGLADNYDVRKLIKSRGELFRDKVPLRRLTLWKQEMLDGKRLPSWIRDKDKSEQKTAIETLKPEDIFRNQFRAEFNAPRAPIGIITWGLEHIDRLRKANAEAREEKNKRLTSFWLPLISAITALVAVLNSNFSQYTNIKAQRELKYYEVELNPKRQGYASFMLNLTKALDNAGHKNHVALVSSLDDMETAYHSIEPFLINSGMREELWQQFQQFSIKCYEFSDSTPENHQQILDELLDYRISVQKKLYKALFVDQTP